ncbi:MAG: hypothetical protein K2Q12_00670 [Rickettsiales bacterium]|nr:hypothetical protein [Rickettsiales bacterium]
MADFKQTILSTPREFCNTLHYLTDSSLVAYKEGQLDKLNDFFHQNQFHDLEFLGHGSHAVVVAPRDSKEFVIRISPFHCDERKEIPYMLQAIGKPLRVATHHAEGKEWGGYRIEFLKRLDMNVAKPDMQYFLEQITHQGYGADSLGRGSEIGWYHYVDSQGRDRKVLIGADPSALSKRRDSSLPLPEAHPSLEDQYKENLRIARSEPRLTFLIPDIEHQLRMSVNAVKSGEETGQEMRNMQAEEPAEAAPTAKVDEIAEPHAPNPQAKKERADLGEMHGKGRWEKLLEEEKWLGKKGLAFGAATVALGAVGYGAYQWLSKEPTQQKAH